MHEQSVFNHAASGAVAVAVSWLRRSFLAQTRSHPRTPSRREARRPPHPRVRSPLRPQRRRPCRAPQPLPDFATIAAQGGRGGEHQRIGHREDLAMPQLARTVRSPTSCAALRAGRPR